jgi:hypothetical protein
MAPRLSARSGTSASWRSVSSCCWRAFQRGRIDERREVIERIADARLAASFGSQVELRELRRLLARAGDAIIARAPRTTRSRSPHAGSVVCGLASRAISSAWCAGGSLRFGSHLVSADHRRACPPLSGRAHIRRDRASEDRGSRPRGCGSRPRGCGSRPRGCGSRPRGCGSRPRGCGSRPRGCGSRQRGCGSRPRGCGVGHTKPWGRTHEGGGLCPRVQHVRPGKPPLIRQPKVLAGFYGSLGFQRFLGS